MATTVLGLKTFAASDPVDYNEVNDNYTKIDNGVKTAMQGRAAQNLLDNSDFRNPVNQRGIYGTTESENNRYTIDRWKSYLTSIDVSQTGMLLSGQYGSNYNTIYQYVPLTPDGRTYTAALYYADGTVKCASGDFLTIAGGIGPEYGVLLEKDSGGNPYVQLYTYSGKRIIGAALYEGSYTADTLPAYQPKGYAAELAECQRYYIHCGEGSWMTGLFKVGEGLIVEIPAANNIRALYPTIIVNSPKIFTTNGWYDITYASCAVTKCWTKLLFNLPEEANPYITHGSAYIITGIVGVSADL